MEKKVKKCIHGKNGICYAYVCYSDEKCDGKDDNGNPNYAGINEIKERDKRLKESGDNIS